MFDRKDSAAGTDSEWADDNAWHPKGGFLLKVSLWMALVLGTLLWLTPTSQVAVHKGGRHLTIQKIDGQEIYTDPATGEVFSPTPRSMETRMIAIQQNLARMNREGHATEASQKEIVKLVSERSFLGFAPSPSEER